MGRSPRSRKARSAPFRGSVPPIFDNDGQYSELLAIVLSLLLPYDLVQLSRVNKRFHSVLLSGAALEWKRAKLSMPHVPPLPATPPWLNELQYASLCFEDHCQGCLAPDVGATGRIWQYGVRLCDGCRQSRFVAESSVDLRAILGNGIKTVFRRISSFVPAVYFAGQDGPYLYIHAVDSFAKQLADGKNRDIPQSILNTWRGRILTIQLTHTQIYREWIQDRYRRAEQELLELLDQRRNAMLDKVVDLGYQPEVDHLGLSYEGLTGSITQIMAKPQPLTSSEWGRIKSTVEDWFRLRRYNQERLFLRKTMMNRLGMLDAALKSYFEQSARLVTPHAVDIALHQEIRTVCQLHPSVFLTVAAFTQLVPEIYQSWASHRRSVLNGLICTDEQHLPMLPLVENRAIKTRSSKRRGPTDPLELARAVFFCTFCCSAMNWSTATVHECLYGQDSVWERTKERVPFLDGYIPTIEGDVFESACLIAYQGRLSWSVVGLRGCTNVATKVVAACGLDPGSAVAEDLDKHDPRIACGLCSIARKTLVVMGWRTAVLHDLRQHGDSSCQWKAISKHIREKVEQVEQNTSSQSQRDFRSEAYWTCGLCGYPGSGRVFNAVSDSSDRISRHLQTQ
ncbi:hypothetical protein C8Q74DRAFT_321613 [Fomes fomentarius]|nr:hypothetical protein C8Q74DRAFT_321613 [Fomes fomentarius]